MFVSSHENPIYVHSGRELLPLIPKCTTSSLSLFLGCHAPLQVCPWPPSPPVCLQLSGDLSPSDNAQLTCQFPQPNQDRARPRLRPMSAAFTCKQRRRLHTVCCQRLSWLALEGQKVSDCILKVHSATHALHVVLHSATRGSPSSPSNDCSKLPWVLEQQARLPPRSRSQGRP